MRIRGESIFVRARTLLECHFWGRNDLSDEENDSEVSDDDRDHWAATKISF